MWGTTPHHQITLPATRFVGRWGFSNPDVNHHISHDMFIFFWGIPELIWIWTRFTKDQFSHRNISKKEQGISYVHLCPIFKQTQYFQIFAHWTEKSQLRLQVVLLDRDEKNLERGINVPWRLEGIPLVPRNGSINSPVVQSEKTYHQLKTGKVVKLWLNQLSIYGRIMVDITILYFYRWAYDWQGQYFGLCAAFESRLFFNGP